MNKKCGNCGWRSDKCKNPNSIHFNEFRERDDRCSIKPKTEVIHLFDIEHYSKFPSWEKDRNNATKCGYVRTNITRDVNKVTCKLCLKALKSNS